DLLLLRKYILKTEQHLTEKTFALLRAVFPTSPHSTLKVTKSRVQELSGFQAKYYSCCINSCVCYVGLYKDLTECPYCHEAARDAKGKPRQVFAYLPLVPRLQAMTSSPHHAEKMRYRGDFQHEPGKVRDVFDGSHYRSLLNKTVSTKNSEDPQPPFCHFSDKRDIALGLSTDGFAPFKQRNKTCWPIILFNYNLPPDIRFQKRYCISLGTIPGPKKPSDMDSFLWPLVQELHQLANGVKTFDPANQSLFLLHAYLIIIFGDIPAMAMIMRMKGANGISPCRICNIKAVRGGGSNTYYVPLRRDAIPNADPKRYDSSALPIRNHDELMAQATEVENAQNKAARERLAKEHGIKGSPILGAVSSIVFPASFPFDFMHVIWENLIPNLILLWTGVFKDLDHQHQDYVIEPRVWNDIGTATAAAKATIPSAFGAPVPNIATHRSQMTSEMYSNWTLFIAPIVLQGRFKKDKYYKHFIKLVHLLKSCLAFEFTEDDIAHLDDGFRKWVQDYEKLYYQHDPRRLSTCPLTIHALLHIAWGIRVAGPVWTYWAYPMERHCNSLLPSIKSRRHPYASINAFVAATAQVDQIRLKYNLFRELTLSVDEEHGETTSAHVLTHHSYPSYKLCPPKRVELVPPSLRAKIYATLATRFNTTKAAVEGTINLDQPILQYGTVVRLEGDSMKAADLSSSREDGRDATHIKYVQLVDRHARCSRREAEFDEQEFYGQLKRILVLELPPLPRFSLNTPTTIFFAVVQRLNTVAEHNNIYYRDVGPIEVIDLNTVECLVGRVWDQNLWAIVDRSYTRTINFD
ncbi:hypothetical protein AGABI1DRAFT_48245, partial [Agaricus bisporus var. burnettii JB137-S8]